MMTSEAQAVQRHRASQSQPKSAVRQQPYKSALVGSVELTFSSFPISHLHFVSLLAVSDDELDADGDKRSLFYRDARRRTFHALRPQSAMASPAIPGLFFCFAAAVLLVFVSVSSPTWEKISFLNVREGGRLIHFGVFGYTGTGKHIGYTFEQSILGFEYVLSFYYSLIQGRPKLLAALHD